MAHQTEKPEDTSISMPMDSTSKISKLEDDSIIPIQYGSPAILKFEKSREWIRPFVAEGVATFFYVLFGCGATAVTLYSEGIQGSRFTIGLAFSLGIVLAVFFAAPISGGHSSPAITVSLALFRGFPWKLVPFYTIAHVAGAFFAAAFVYLSFYSTIIKIDGGDHQILGKTSTVGAFVHFPAPNVSTGYQVWVEFLSCFMLMFSVFALLDHNNKILAKNIVAVPFLIGMVILCLSLGIGYEGIALNPARDLGARMFAAIIYGHEVFTLGNYFFWVPLIVPFIGSIAGAGFYDLVFFKHASKPEYPSKD